MRTNRLNRLFVFVLLLLCGPGSGNQELFGPIHFGAEGPLSTEAAYYRRTDPKGEVKALVLFTKEFRLAHKEKEPWFSAIEGEATPNKDHDLRLEFGEAKIELTRMSAFVVVQGDGSLVFLKPFKVTDLELFEYMKADPSNRSLEGVRKLGEKFVGNAGENAARVPDLPDSDPRKQWLEEKMEVVKLADARFEDVAIYFCRKSQGSVVVRDRRLADRIVAIDFKGGTVKEFLSSLCEAAGVSIRFEKSAIEFEARESKPIQPANK
jgi:hypothetical protein